MLTLALLIGLVDPPAPPTVAAAKAPERPAAVEVAAGRGLVRLAADAPSEWFSVSPLAELVVSPDRKSAVFLAPGPGRWPVLVWTVKGDLSSAPREIAVTVGGGPPTPMPPAPPTPVDTFAAALKAAYAADPSDAKKDQAKLLVLLYREAEKKAADPGLATGAQLIEQVRKTAAALKIDGLVAVRTLVAEELGKAIELTTPLAELNRKAVADIYARAASALDKPE